MELRESLEELAPLAEAILVARDKLDKLNTLDRAIDEGEKKVSSLREDARQAVSRLEKAKADIAALPPASAERERIIDEARVEAGKISARIKAEAEDSVRLNAKRIEEQTTGWYRKLVDLAAQSKTLQAEIDRKRTEHDQVQSSIDALRRRLDGRA